MMNYCANSLSVKGDFEQVVKFDNKFKGEHTYGIDGKEYTKTGYSFLNFITTDKDNTPDRLTSWLDEHWGTKGDIDEYMYITKPKDNNGLGKAVYNFDTPWTPPEKVYYKMSKEFPELTFTYYYEEQGYELNGEAVIKNGERIEGDSLE